MHQVYGGLCSFFQKLALPAVPRQWELKEESMRAFIRSSQCRMLDDKGSQKLWSSSTSEIAASLVHGIAQDPGWRMHLSLEPRTIKAFGYTRAAAGLPFFLRTQNGRLRKTTIPRLFPLEKSKCYLDNGSHVCRKPLRSTHRAFHSRLDGA